jgi:putative ABC transport system substrate-binding protein
MLAIFWLAGAGWAMAQERRVVVLESMRVPAVTSHGRWFTHYFSEMAAADHLPCRVETLQAQGDWERAEQLLKRALADGRPAVVVANATLAAKTADRLLKDTGIPLVFMTVSDPVGAGLIDTIGVAGGRNVTGIVHTIHRDTRINLLMRLLGEAVRHRPVRIGFVHSTYPSAVGDLRELRAAAQGRDDIVFVPFQVEYHSVSQALPAMLAEVQEGVQQLEAQVDFWWEPSGPLGESNEYTRLLLDHSRHPIAMGLKAKSVAMGALMHLSPNEESTGHDAAMLVLAILKGADAGKLPAQPPEKFDMGINLTAAMKAGLVVPPDLLTLAGSNVYR